MSDFGYEYGTAPYMFDHINSVNSQISPSAVHVADNEMAHYFRRYLLQKAMSVFEWTLPETWSRDYFLYVLYCWGYISVINTTSYGVIPQACALRGYDIFYRPNIAVITNPLLKGMKELKIDKQCTLFKLQPDYGGIMDMINYYADMMALAIGTAGVNLINSKVSFVFTASDKAASESFKKAYDDIASGKPMTVIDKELRNSDGSRTWEPFQQNVGANYIVSDILADMQTIENMFNTDVGIPNANTDKKERMIKAEVESNNTETESKCALWLEQLKACCKKTRDMFDIDIDVEWRFEKEQRENLEKENRRRVEIIEHSRTI